MWRLTLSFDDVDGGWRTLRDCTRWQGFSRLAGRSAVAVLDEGVEAVNRLLGVLEAYVEAGVRKEILRRMGVIEDLGNLLEGARRDETGDGA